MPSLVLFLLLLLPAQTRPADATLLRNLADESYETRQRASQALLADDSLTVEDLARLYAAATLPEQRHRLLDAAQHHFVRRLVEQQFPAGQAGTGSLGVMLLPGTGPADTPDQPARATARIGSTYPGFPAYVWLRPGDLVLAVNGHTLPATDDAEVVQRRFQELVKSNPPGAALRLTLLREGQEMDVTIKLAPYEALRNLYEQSDPSLMPTMQARWLAERRQITAGGPPEKALIPNLDPFGRVSAPEPPEPRVNRSDADDAEPRFEVE